MPLESSVYVYRHIKVHRKRGRAADQFCVHCGEQAREWATTHGTTGEELDDYFPLCRACHVIYDDYVPQGEDNGRAVLSNAQVEEIRKIGAAFSQREIGKRYGVDPSTISRILSRKRRALA